MLPGLRIQIDRDAPFIAVTSQERRALPIPLWWTPIASVVTRPRGFNFDDVCAQISKQHGAIRTGQVPRQIQDGDVAEGLGK